MNKLTAEKCRERIKKFKRLKKQFGIAMETELSLQAYEIALPMLEQQEKGDDGWIDWKGGDCPLHEETIVIVKFSDGGRDGPGPAYLWHWEQIGHSLDVFAYRVIENDGREG